MGHLEQKQKKLKVVNVSYGHVPNTGALGRSAYPFEKKTEKKHINISKTKMERLLLNNRDYKDAPPMAVVAVKSW